MAIACWEHELVNITDIENKNVIRWQLPLISRWTQTDNPIIFKQIDLVRPGYDYTLFHTLHSLGLVPDINNVDVTYGVESTLRGPFVSPSYAIACLVITPDINNDHGDGLVLDDYQVRRCMYFKVGAGYMYLTLSPTCHHYQIGKQANINSIMDNFTPERKIIKEKWTGDNWSRYQLPREWKPWQYLFPHEHATQLQSFLRMY